MNHRWKIYLKGYFDINYFFVCVFGLSYGAARFLVSSISCFYNFNHYFCNYGVKIDACFWLAKHSCLDAKYALVNRDAKIFHAKKEER